MKRILSLKSRGKVLDLGCGTGENSIFLAKNGFEVTAFDKIESSLHKTRNLAFANNVFVNTCLKDVTNFRTEEKFDIILFLGILHNLEERQAAELVKYSRKITNIGGMHVLDIYPVSNSLNPVGIKDMYRDWNVIEFREMMENGNNFYRLIALRLG